MVRAGPTIPVLVKALEAWFRILDDLRIILARDSLLIWKYLTVRLLRSGLLSKLSIFERWARRATSRNGRISKLSGRELETKVVFAWHAREYCTSPGPNPCAITSSSPRKNHIFLIALLHSRWKITGKKQEQEGYRIITRHPLAFPSNLLQIHPGWYLDTFGPRTQRQLCAMSIP
jgi:hypothetical protein